MLNVCRIVSFDVKNVQDLVGIGNDIPKEKKKRERNKKLRIGFNILICLEKKKGRKREYMTTIIKQFYSSFNNHQSVLP